MTRHEITEAAAAVAPVDGDGNGLVQLITPGWGSSGYYSPEVLAEAAASRVFPAGTHMYLDHPAGDGSGVDAEGNRSVRDLAAVLLEDARTDDAGGLQARVRVFGPWRPVLAEVKDAIGVSIRARGTAEMGEADGRKGMIVTELDKALSVDFVVAAGRGGKILELAESARAEAAEDPELLEANVSDVRAALQTEVDETYGGQQDDGCYCDCWVRDFDPDTGTAYFEIRAMGDASLYAQPYTLNPDGTVELTGERTEVTAQTSYVPVTSPDPDAGVSGESATTDGEPVVTEPAGQTPAPAPSAEQEESTMTGAPGAGASPLNPRQVLEQGLAETRRELAEFRARERAREIITEELAEAWLSPAPVARLTSEQLRELPMHDDQLDEARLRERVVAARTLAESEAAEVLQAAGYGKPRGMSSMPQLGSGGGQNISESRVTDELAELFGEMGLDKSAAEHAAKGR